MVVCQWNDNHDKFSSSPVIPAKFKEIDDQNLKK